MSRKGNSKKANDPSPHDDDLALVGEFPELLLPPQQRQERWSRRILQLTQTIDQSGTTVAYLTTQLEEREREMRLVCEAAGLLCQLQIDEWRKKQRENYFRPGTATVAPQQPPGSAGGGRGSKAPSRPGSSIANNNNNYSAPAPAAAAGGPGTLESVVKSLADGKKRHKLVQTLTQFFASTPAPSPAERKGQPSGPEFEKDLLALPQPLPATGATPDEKATEGAGGAAEAAAEEGDESPPDTFQKYIADEPRRPKDVPAELWQEVSQLRARKLFLSLEEIQPLKRDLEAQTKRALLLGESYRLAVYGLEGATKVFEAAKKEAAENKAQMEANAAALESAEGARAGSKKGRTPSPNQKKQTA